MASSVRHGVRGKQEEARVQEERQAREVELGQRDRERHREHKEQREGREQRLIALEAVGEVCGRGERPREDVGDDAAVEQRDEKRVDVEHEEDLRSAGSTQRMGGQAGT